MALNIDGRPSHTEDILYPRLDITIMPASQSRNQSPGKDEITEDSTSSPPSEAVQNAPPPLYPALPPVPLVDKEITRNNSQISTSADGKAALGSPSTFSASSKSVGVATDDLTGFVTRDSDYAAHGGGYADVYKGVLRKNNRTTRVWILELIMCSINDVVKLLRV